ncbi:GNAT family N-acetyltransferase [Xylophilus sp. GW821-FHT01B05]
MKIRIATPADITAVFDVRTSVRENHMSMAELAAIGVTPDTLAAMLSGDGRGWVAQEQGEVMAFAMADAADATVFAMFVRSSSEGRGLGRQLMAQAEQ